MTWSSNERLRLLVEQQAGVLTRAQALLTGATPGTVRGLLRSGRWQSPLPGVYVAFSGPCPPMTRVWVAVLHCGPGAVAARATAGWLWELCDDLPTRLEVFVPAARRVRTPPPWISVRRSPSLGDRAHPTASPPRTRLEDTVLDLTDVAERAADVVDVLTRACQRRLTTAARLAEVARGRARLRWRALVMEVLADIGEGVHSELERRWARDVERAHALPRGDRNVAEGVEGRRVYRDVVYAGWSVVVELDGAAAHPAELRHLDRARDRWLSARGVLTLRFGWREVADEPCLAAAELAAALRARGWRGRVQPCGLGCAAPGAASRPA
jgi:hypothetical protein